MTARPSARRELRLRTADMHDRVDGIFSHADLTTPEGYGRFLMAQAAAHLAVEDALTAAGADHVIDDWNSRRRSALLLDDLGRLGLDPPARLPHSIAETDTAVIGGVYVLEGSRLGGALLKQSVAPELPATFLSASSPSAWRRLIEIIDQRLDTADALEAAIVSARDVFSTFERSGRQFLKVN